MFKEVNNESGMKTFGESIGLLLQGGEFIELVGDVGSGKTTLAKGIAVGLGVRENVQSPSFTINRVYGCRDGIALNHYDFYRLNDAGIMANELQESVVEDKTVVIVEWAGVVGGVLPVDRLSINITSPTETSRQLILSSGGIISERIVKQLAL
jgi:tRNA threonylcarbamoyladenosine biosynthesis protein TsaE